MLPFLSYNNTERFINKFYLYPVVNKMAPRINFKPVEASCLKSSLEWKIREEAEARKLNWRDTVTISVEGKNVVVNVPEEDSSELQEICLGVAKRNGYYASRKGRLTHFKVSLYYTPDGEERGLPEWDYLTLGGKK